MDTAERGLPRPQPPFTWRLQISFVVAAAVLLGLGFGLEHTVHRVVSRESWHLTAAGWAPLAWFVWLMAAPAILLLVGRFRAGRADRTRALLALVGGSLAVYGAVVIARFGLSAVLRLWAGGPEAAGFGWHEFWVLTLASLPMDFLTFGGFFAAALAIGYYTQHRQRAEEALALRLRTAQLESQLANAELAALRGQLHPHFLFNSFNAVASLVRQNRNEAAVEVIAELSMLLRLVMQRSGQHTLTLEEELDFIRRYLAVERIRFGEKLQLRYDIEPATLGARVPTLVLQPLVENAIKHGIARRTSPGVLRLGARFAADRLELLVENDGAETGSPSGIAAESGGVGLTNTRARLDKFYGVNYHLELTRRTEGGMRVSLSLPRADAANPLPN